MKNSLIDAKEEFKRCDHLLYVSLKYTRTVDVIKSLISRLISTYGFMVDALLKKKKVKEIPEQIGLKIDMIRKLFADDEMIMKNIDDFMMLRKLDKAEYTRHKEYRRPVHMLAKVDDKEVHIGIDEMMGYYQQLKELLDFFEETP